MTIRIGDHYIIRNDADADDDSRRRRSRVPTAFIHTNRDRSGGGSSRNCPDCMRRPMNNQIVKMIFDKKQSAFTCPVCWGTYLVNPVNSKEMQPGTTNPLDNIPSLDGLTESDAVAKDLEGKTQHKPMVRSIGNAHKRSQYSSQSVYHTDNPFEADKETLELAERINGTLVDYREYIPQDNNTFTSSSSDDPSRRRARLEV